VCGEITLGKLPNLERINYENHGHFCLFANCHNLLLTKLSRTFLQPIVKGANFDSFVGVEKAKRPTCRRPRRVRRNVINPYHLLKKPSNF
jgi:hypothetical protein